MKSDEKAKESPAGRAKRARPPKPRSIGRISPSHTPSSSIQPEEVNLTRMLEMLQPHDHLCLIYESQEEWRAAAVPFISIGLKRGEKCIYVVDTSTADEIRTYLSEEGIDVAATEKSGQLSILHESEAYTREGSFDPDRMIALIISETEKAVAEGYPALRATAEMTWMLHGYPGSEKLLEYEAKLNRDFFPKYPCLAICQYDRWKFDPEIIKGVVMTHPLLIKGNRVYRNFYYIPPVEFLTAKRAELEVQHWLNNLDREQRAWEALRESETRYRAITEDQTELICRFRQDGTLTFVNEAFCRYFDKKREELIGNSVPPLIHEEDRKLVELQFASLSWENPVATYEHRVVAADGEIRWMQWADRAIFDESGNPVEFQSVGRDITERKQTEEALRESEATARALLNAPTDVVGLVDTRGVILDVNETVAQRFGRPVDELIGVYGWDLIPPDLAERRKAYFGQVIQSSEPVRFEDERQGTWFDNVFYPVFDAQGKVTKVAILARDITERKRAERLLRALNEAALAMERALTPEEIFAAVAEEFKKLGFSCAVFPTDESQSGLFPTYLSHETRALKAAEKLVGLRREDFSIPIETVDAYRKVVQERETVFVENVVDTIRQMLPEPLKRFARQVAKILQVPRAIDAPLIVEDEVIGMLAVQSGDLTEDDIPAITAFAHQMAAAWRKAQLMQDLQNSLEELKQTQAQLVQLQKMEAIGQLAAGIAHDFNNLLTPIGGFAELLLWKIPEGSQQQEYLRQIKLAADRATALTGQLRLFTRQAKGQRQPVQLNSVVEETRVLLERSISREITIELGLESKLWAVEADSSQLSQVLMNLGVNARDAMPEGGTLTLETRNVTLDEEYARMVLEARPGRYVRLSVSDTGSGMSPAVQARLFEPFFTTKEMGQGTGLGLSVVYGIVKGHEGFIQVYSQEGRGSTFHVYLPAIEGAVEEGELKEWDLPTGTETILVVDDEEMVRTLGQAVLESRSYTVLMAEDGVQALEVYQAHRGEIALVVLDVIMPQMGGRECLRRLRGLDPQVKVLISTGYTAKSLAEELVGEGALGVVEKPFRIHDFATAVRAALDRP
jgi:PAS domain S-box-containing protein